MIGKVLSFAMVTAVTVPVAVAQTPAPAPRPESRTFSFSWNGDGGYLGVQTEEVTRENYTKFGLRDVRGVAVNKVMEGSPAQSAGLQNGDVIIRVNGEDISSGRKLTRLIDEISPDHTAKVTVLRGGAEREINVTLGKRPAPRFEDGSFSFPEVFEKFDLPQMPDLEKLERYRVEPGKPGEPLVYAFGNRRQIGVALTPLTKQLSDHFNVTNGALVNNVRENSPAAKAGLKAGDVITEVEGKAVKGEMDVVRAIAEKKEGDISLVYVRGGQKNTVRVTPEKAEGNFFEYFERDSDSPEGGKPGVFRLERPGSPMPLNQVFLNPGRVV